MQLRTTSLAQDPTAVNTHLEDPFGDALRTQSLAFLEPQGFRVSPALPTAGHRPLAATGLRPLREIAQRLMALDAVVTWVAFDPVHVPDEDVERYAELNDARSHLSPEEVDILDLSRAEAHDLHIDGIGWRMESMWPLAWALGFDDIPEVSGEQIPGPVINAMIKKFMPGLSKTVDDLLARAEARSHQEIAGLEDVFYCAHHAATSAQLGDDDAVPEEFHPVIGTGVIHQRRHALTWMVSPGVQWDDTDLST